MHDVPQRIVVGVSAEPEADELTLSACDRHTFAHVAWLAERVDAEIHLVHVIDFIDERLGEEEDNVDGPVKAALRDALEALADTTSAKTEIVFRRGKPWRQLIAEAEAWDADLIAVSPRRESLGLTDRIFHGSTAARVLRRSERSVWVVDREAHTPIEKVLALVDGSPVSQLVLDAAGALTQALGGKRYALRCLDYPEDISMKRLADAEEAIAEYHRAVHDKAKAELDALVGDHPCEVLFSEDWVVRAAPKVIEQHDIDLVVLSSTSRTGLADLLGSTAEKLLQRSIASAWVVQPKND